MACSVKNQQVQKGQFLFKKQNIFVCGIFVMGLFWDF